MEKIWWIEVMVERLKARGELSVKPESSTACFYGNPLGDLAQDVGADMADPEGWQTDLCRDWTLVTNRPKVWDFLANSGEFTVHAEQVRHEKFLQVLVQLCEGRVFQWAALYEWMTQELLHKERSVIPVKKPFPRMLLRAYAAVFERIRQGLALSDDVLEPFRPAGRHRKRPKPNGRDRQVYLWEKAPPYAAMLLIPYQRSAAGEEARGGNLLRKYLDSAKRGEIVETPGRVCDLPNSRTRSRPDSVLDRFESAMAVDVYVSRHPRRNELIEHIKAMKWPMEGIATMPIAFQTSEQYAEALALAWVNPSGKQTVEAGTSPQRYAPTSSDLTGSKVQFRNCRLSMDDEEPLVSMQMALPANYPGDVYDLKVVMLTEATIDGVDQFDTCFGHVDYADAKESGETLSIELELRPTYASYSLLYQLERCEIPPTAKAVVMPVVSRGVSTMVVGVHVVLGSLRSINKVA